MTYYIVCVSYYAETPHILLGERGNLEIVVLAYFLISGVVWILAAEFHNQVSNILFLKISPMYDVLTLDTLIFLDFFKGSKNNSYVDKFIHNQYKFNYGKPFDDFDLYK